MSTPALGADDRAERWARTKALFAEAVTLSASERADFLRERCAGDDALLDEVASLLATHDASPEYLEGGIGALGMSAEPVAEPSLVGQRLGPYRLVREIGRGGMGAVYLAERDDDEFRQRVAVKVMRDASLVRSHRRFRRERQILADLDHPNIARLLDGGTSDEGVPYVVMEHVDGEPIDRFCATRGLDLRARLALFRTVCGAVHYAHQRLVVHRDIKPANILVTADGTVKLLDFGIATLVAGDEAATAPGEVTANTWHALTPEYASPEQIVGGVVTTLSDVYSLGMLLFVLVAERHPFRAPGRPTLEVARLIAESEPPRPSESAGPARRGLRGDVDTIVLTAMRHEPARRYGSAERLSDDVRRHLEGLPLAARPDTVGYRTAMFVRRNRVAVTAAALALVAFAGAGASALWQARTARAERARAVRRFDEVRELATSFLVEVHDSIAPLPGSTPVRALLVRRAVTTLDGLAPEARDDASLQQELAAAYLRVGDVQGLPYAANLGDTQGAIASYRKALAILRRLTLDRPRDRAARHSLVLAEQRLATVLTRDGSADDAVASARRALALSDSLASSATDAADRDSALGLAAHAHILLARAVYQRPEVPRVREAITHFGAALDIRERLLAESPHDDKRLGAVAYAQSNVAYGLWKLAEITNDTASWRAALVRLRAAEGIRGRMADVRPTPGRRRNAADARREVATVELKLGDMAGAARDSRAAVATFDSLARSDPSNVEARRDLALAYAQLGEAEGRSGQMSAASRHLGEAIRLMRAIVAADASSAEDREYLHRMTSALDSLGRRRARP